MTYPQYPQYPQGQPYPQQPYPQQPYPAAPPPQPVAQPYPAPAPAGPPLAKGSLDDFYSQPSSGGGPVVSWKDKPIGTTYAGIVSRPITAGDIRQQTNPQGMPQTYRDGRPKFEMVVPLTVASSQEFPEGQARWIVRGQARDELVRAMAEAGAPEGPPEAGAAVTVTLVQRRPTGAGFNPANVVQVRYVRPQGGAAPVVEQAAPAPQPVQQPAPAPQATPAQPVAQAQAEAAPQPPGDLSPEQQQLLNQLTNQG